ncbi:acetylornithine deacetylase [Parasedimentitalea maritima]|uniref:Acetylornithine deacetylase n=1 Tax=Parasedimentitalea maritima TaxID=2578117 RepID=A0ABY2UZA8_9RHOB|nr:acetylornithine deacetylase [Zongyanglinia marina]TLP62687.1 acetylornithine deacetylase [Zongyanglinia marina]
MTDDLTHSLSVLSKLIGFPTVSDQSNVDLIHYIMAYLDEFDVKYHIFPDSSATKLGLIAQIGPNVEGGTILSGHTDVVPIAGQVWSSDPWILTERDGRFYGRGTCDMKGFVALALAAVPKFASAPLARPIQLAFSFDEEVGCLGTAPLLTALETHFPQAETVIVGEPTSMSVVTGHKGGLGLVTRLHGKAAHSSRPDLGASAISHADPLIQWHSARQEKARTSSSASGFIPPYSTVQVGTIKGGVALNTVPDLCVFESDIRYMPHETASDWVDEYRALVGSVEDAMRTECDDARIELEVTEDIPAMLPEPSGAAEVLARQLTGDNSDNCVSYQTEAGHFQAAGYSTVVCGPGSIEQAHGPDEFISANQLRQGQAFMERLITALC